MITKSILKRVRKPGRYLGTEVHAIRKNWLFKKCTFAIAFPDLYEIGMSQLGLQIIYALINKEPDCVCERVFAPALDLEEILRTEHTPLTSLESNKPLHAFDIVGFSLHYELSYTNILTMLDLGGIPLYARDRGARDPIVIGGGPCTANPEVMADFFDCFLIGEGEESIPAFINCYKKHRMFSGHINRNAFLKEAATVPGIYVPHHYEAQYDNAHVFTCLKRVYAEAPDTIAKSRVPDLNAYCYPEQPIIPFIKTVHDRVSIEIMRGCPNHCSYCQARSYYGHYRIRSQENIRSYAKQLLAATGHDEISLLSLSSGDYPRIEELLSTLMEDCKAFHASLSLPSLRVEKMVKILPFYLSVMKKTGLTFAPEAGSDRLRQHIGKNINIDYLMRAADEAFRIGYKHIKLYFMIGLPTEEEKDLDGLVQLIFDCANVRKKHAKKAGQINVTISNFIPKPHTQFERELFCYPAILKQRQEYLRKKLQPKFIKYNFTDINVSILEACFSRGDRRLGAVVHEAWKRGARLDAWNEHFTYSYWDEAFKTVGIDPVTYATRQYEKEAALPWGHIAL